MSQPHEPTEPTPPTPREAQAEVHSAPPPDQAPQASEQPAPPAQGEPAPEAAVGSGAGEPAPDPVHAGPPPGRPGVPAYGPYVPVGAPRGHQFGPTFTRFARSRATQVVAAMVVGAIIGGGTVAIVGNVAGLPTQQVGGQNARPGQGVGPFGPGGQGYRHWYGGPFGGGQGSGG